MSGKRAPGRPAIRTDAEILEAALAAFAASGFDSMSVRGLNATLGLSHETIGQRFGSKRALYFAALDHGFADYFVVAAEERSMFPPDLDDLDELRATLVVFVRAAGRRPLLGQVINHESVHAGERLDYIFERALAPSMRMVAEVVERLVERGEIQPTSARELFFVGQAGAAPFALSAMSAAFDRIDGPLDAELYVQRFTDFVIRGLGHQPT